MKKYKNIKLLEKLNDFDSGLGYVGVNEEFAQLFYVYHLNVTERLKNKNDFDKFVDRVAIGFATTNRVIYGDFIIQEPKLLRRLIFTAINNPMVNFKAFCLKFFDRLKYNHIVIDTEELQDLLAEVDSILLDEDKKLINDKVISYLEEVYTAANSDINKIIRRTIDSGTNIKKALSIKIPSPCSRPFSNIINKDNQRKVIDDFFKETLLVDVDELLYILGDSIDVDEIDYHYILEKTKYSNHIVNIADFFKDYNVEIPLEEYKESCIIQERIFYYLVKEDVEKDYKTNLMFDILQDRSSRYVTWAEEQAKDCEEELLKLAHENENLCNSLNVLKSFDSEEELKFLQKAVKEIKTVEDYSLIEADLQTIYHDVLLRTSLLDETYDKTLKRAANIKCIAELYNLLKQIAIEKNIITKEEKENGFQHQRVPNNC